MQLCAIKLGRAVIGITSRSNSRSFDCGGEAPPPLRMTMVRGGREGPWQATAGPSTTRSPDPHKARVEEKTGERSAQDDESKR